MNIAQSGSGKSTFLIDTFKITKTLALMIPTGDSIKRVNKMLEIEYQLAYRCFTFHTSPDVLLLLTAARNIIKNYKSVPTNGLRINVSIDEMGTIFQKVVVPNYIMNQSLYLVI